MNSKGNSLAIRLLALGLLTTLIGCNQTGGDGTAGRVAAGKELPTMRGEARKPCDPPTVAVGESPRVTSIRTGASLQVCERRRAAAVRFADSLVTHFNAPGAPND